jgi:hypothetical protein
MDCGLAAFAAPRNDQEVKGRAMKVLCTNGVKAVTAELIPAVGRTIGLSIDVDYGSTN